ncbi:MAG: HAD-IIIA family hydrolase, partial [Candidatus Omnitrophota bacterium]
FRIFVISNQAGVSKGIYSQENLDEMTQNMLKELEGDGIHIDGVHYCIHRDEDHCSCRKPKTGLLDRVMSELQEKGFSLEIKESFFIGDTIRDMETGKKAGLKTILVFSGKEKPENKKSWPVQPDFTADSLLEAVPIILK